MSVLATSELGPGIWSDSQNPGPSQDLARMTVLARSDLGPGFWLGSMVGPRILDLAKISNFAQKSRFWQIP